MNDKNVEYVIYLGKIAKVVNLFQLKEIDWTNDNDYIAVMLLYLFKKDTKFDIFKLFDEKRSKVLNLNRLDNLKDNIKTLVKNRLTLVFKDIKVNKKPFNITLLDSFDREAFIGLAKTQDLLLNKEEMERSAILLNDIITYTTFNQ